MGSRANLAEMMAEIEWTWLLPHAKRDALVMVTPGLDLLDVGEAIANDNVASVQNWIGEQLTTGLHQPNSRPGVNSPPGNSRP